MEQLTARRLGPENRAVARALLVRDPVANLFLLDLCLRLGAPPAPGEAPTEMIGAWRGETLLAVAALRPTVAVSAAPPEVLELFLPYLEPLAVGLMKSATEVVDPLWRQLGRSRRRHVLLDRLETAYAVRPHEANPAEVRPHERVRAANPDDLDSLVVAARESLREEDRPDPFAGDVRSFRRWVEGRVARARVVESQGVIVCVGYADVRLREGWLIQGVYTWPEARRRGFARTGVADLCRQAFSAGAEHVQLAVVDGNRAAERLYESLGFKPVGKLRTILFT
ncbi:MAG: GNAT family N-acetyltransferase [Planctomycetota bacterium]